MFSQSHPVPAIWVAQYHFLNYSQHLLPNGKDLPLSRDSLFQEKVPNFLGH